MSFPLCFFLSGGDFWLYRDYPSDRSFCTFQHIFGSELKAYHRERKISPKFFRPIFFFHGRPRGMSVAKYLFFQHLEGLSEVFGRMSARISGQKLPLWAEFSFLISGNCEALDCTERSWSSTTSRARRSKLRWMVSKRSSRRWHTSMNGHSMWPRKNDHCAGPMPWVPTSLSSDTKSLPK